MKCTGRCKDRDGSKTIYSLTDSSDAYIKADYCSVL